ncbi:MAG TPA: PAS domain S-box protein [Deltaproteobacteria bacterium]|nr:PAS domain S-box protein [Deltaproteobacteria bacterium]
MRDIEEAIQGNEATFSVLVENANDVLWVFDLDLGYTYISPSVMRLRGYSVEEAVKLRLDQVLTPESYARVREMLGRELDLMKAGYRHGPGWFTTLELEMVRKDGSTFWAEVIVNLLYDEEGSLKGIMGITRDITKRRAAEEELKRCRDDLEEQVVKRTSELVLINERLMREIEERSRIEAELRESAEMYRVHLSLTNDVMFSYDNQFRVLSVSPNVTRVLGYTPEELVGKTFQEAGVLDPSFMPKAFENALHILAGNPIYSSVYLFITKDGRRRYGEVSGVPCMRDGKVYAVTTVARDITERLEMENALRQSEERYKATLECMPAAVCIVRVSDSRCMYANQAFSAITGYTVEEALGRTTSELDLPPVDELVSPKEGPGECEGRDLEHTLKRKDGGVIKARLSTRPVQYDSQACLVMAITDMTSLMQLEEERARLEAQRLKMDAIATLARGIAHDFNNILTTIIGYTNLSLRNVKGLEEKGSGIETILRDLDEVRRAAKRAVTLVNHIQAFSRHPEREHVPVDLCTLVDRTIESLGATLPSNVTISANLAASCMVKGDPAQLEQVFTNLCDNAAHAMGKTGGEITVSLARATVPEGEREALGLPAGRCIVLRVSDTGPGIPGYALSRVFDPYFTTTWKGEGSGLGLSIVHGIVKAHEGAVTCTSAEGQGACFTVYLPEYVDDKELGQGTKDSAWDSGRTDGLDPSGAHR